MALVRTTLTGNIGPQDKQLVFASATGMAPGRIAKIDSETVLLQAQNPDATLQWTVMRGYGGTTAVAHKSGAPVTTGANSDWPTPGAPVTAGVPVASYSAAGAIAVQAGQTQLLAGSAAAMTLPLPSLADDGLEMEIIAGDAQAYTVTVPTAFQGADTGLVATFGGVAGDNFHIVARNGRWVVLSVGNVSIA